MKLFQTEQAQELIANGLCDPSKPEEVVTTFLPTRATSGSAGYDIRAAIQESVTICVGEAVRLPTGFHLQTEDPSIVGLVFVRSSLGFKLGLIPSNAVGVIDSDFHDQWQVCLHNLREQTVTIVPGQRIAQVVFTPVVHLPELQGYSLDKKRLGGIGSTDLPLSHSMQQLPTFFEGISQTIYGAEYE